MLVVTEILHRMECCCSPRCLRRHSRCSTSCSIRSREFINNNPQPIAFRIACVGFDFKPSDRRLCLRRRQLERVVIHNEVPVSSSFLRSVRRSAHSQTLISASPQDFSLRPPRDGVSASHKLEAFIVPTTMYISRSTSGAEPAQLNPPKPFLRSKSLAELKLGMLFDPHFPSNP